MKQRKNNKVKRKGCLLLLLTMCCGVSAQAYWKENVGAIESTGYHHIRISPEIAGLGLQTLRILDTEDNEIPYFIRLPGEGDGLEGGNTFSEYEEFNIDNCKIEENKETRKTIVSFPAMPYPYYLAKLQLNVKNEEHYNRKAKILNNNNRLAYFYLSSRKENIFNFDNILIGENTTIEIENRDNLPLKIDSIRMFSMNRYLCAFLEEGKDYHIVTDGKVIKQYDIQNFAKEIPPFLPVVQTSGLVPVTLAPEPEIKTKFFEKPYFLWAMIILTGGGLLLICVRMLKEMKKK